MHWGYKILAVFAIFVVGMLGMVYVAMHQTNEMIDDNYYEKELKFQDKINAFKNLTAIAEKIVVLDSSDVVKIKLPTATISAQSTGTIEFVRSSDQRRDITLQLATNEFGVQLLPKTKFIQGQYLLRLNWQTNGKPYFYQQRMMINK